MTLPIPALALLSSLNAMDRALAKLTAPVKAKRVELVTWECGEGHVVTESPCPVCCGDYDAGPDSKED